MSFRRVDQISGRAASVQPHQQAIIREFFEVVNMWVAEQITLTDAAALTGDGWLRYQVITHVAAPPPYDPAFPTDGREERSQYAMAMAFFEALGEQHAVNVIKTGFGWFKKDDLTERGGTINSYLDSVTGVIVEKVEFPPVPEDPEHPTFRPRPYVEAEPSSYEAEWFGTTDAPGDRERLDFDDD